VIKGGVGGVACHPLQSLTGLRLDDPLVGCGVVLPVHRGLEVLFYVEFQAAHRVTAGVKEEYLCDLCSEEHPDPESEGPELQGKGEASWCVVPEYALLPKPRDGPHTWL